MGRKIVPFNEKQSRLALKIEEWFLKNKKPLSFGKILEQYSNPGESCDTVAERLRQITKLKIVRSTFNLAVNLCIQQKKTNFKINAKWKNNPYRKNRTGTRKKNARKIPVLKVRKQSKQNKEKTIKQCFLKCKCGASYWDNLEVNLKTSFMNLMSYQCKKCGQYCSLLKASFINENGEKVIKKIVPTEFDGILMEK